MMKNILSSIAITITVIAVACGDPSVSIDEVKYEPKIVVEGFVYPGEPVKNIWLMRNFVLNTEVDSTQIYLTPENNQVLVTLNGVDLIYDAKKGSYYSNDITVAFNETFTLYVEAVIDGITLQAEISTTTPAEGFDLLSNDLGELIYRRDLIKVDFYPSPGTGFYAFSIRAEDASLDNFIYNNPFFPNNDTTDVEEFFNNFKFQYNLMLNIDGTGQDTISYNILGLDTWFYGDYTVILYAGDRNMKDYLVTANRARGFDGNFHEPRYHFQGEGIGVFASAIRDTLTFTLLPNE